MTFKSPYYSNHYYQIGIFKNIGALLATVFLKLLLYYEVVKIVSKKVKLLLLLIFLGLTLTGVIGLNFFPANILRTTHYVVRNDGQAIVSYNLYQPIGITEPRPVIVMGHGIIVSKEMMTSFAIELAWRGYIVVNLDWCGHGQTIGSLTVSGLVSDLESVLADIPNTAPMANMSEIALIGYSMGGIATYDIAANNSNIKAWVGVGTAPNDFISNTSNPKNVLLIIGLYDQVFSPLEVIRQSMVNLTGTPGVADFQYEVLYGNIADGTARRFHVVPTSEHLMVPWHRDFISTTTDWIVQTFDGVKPSLTITAYDVRFAFLIIGVSGFTGLAFVSALLLADKFRIRKEESQRSQEECLILRVEDIEATSARSFILKYYVHAFLLIPTILVFAVLFLVPLLFSALLGALFGCLGINILIFCWRLTKKSNRSIKSIFKENLFQEPKIWLYSVILTSIFFFGYYSTIGLNYLGFVSSLQRIPFVILYCFLAFVLFFIIFVFLQKALVPLLDEKLKIKNTSVKYIATSLINFLLIYSWFLPVVLIPCIIMNDYFVALILVFLFPIILSLAFFSTYIEKLTGSVIPSVLISALVLGFLMTAMSPLIIDPLGTLVDALAWAESRGLINFAFLIF
ncbi:MAG: alpha/beta hydrolase [Candidatus Helarchaeota archaeon]